MLASLRQLTTLMLVLSALGWATPCWVLQGEFDLSVSESKPQSLHAHHASPSAAAEDPHAHHAGHGAEPPSSEWKPACPCGCEQTPAGTSIGRVGWALVPANSLPVVQGVAERWLTIDASAPDADVDSIDHVPIPS